MLGCCCVGRRVGLLLGVLGLCAPRLGRGCVGRRIGLLLGVLGLCAPRLLLLCPPSGLSLLAVSVSSPVGNVHSNSALPQSTSSGSSSSPSPLVGVLAVASLSVSQQCASFASPAGAGHSNSALPQSTSSGSASSPSPLVGVLAVASLSAVVVCGASFSSLVLPPRCCMAAIFGFALRAVPARLAVGPRSVRVLIFLRMRRAFFSRFITSCGKRIT